jgi:hypothetical protein
MKASVERSGLFLSTQSSDKSAIKNEGNFILVGSDFCRKSGIKRPFQQPITDIKRESEERKSRPVPESIH